MPAPTDADRVNLLPGLLREAAKAKMSREAQLAALEAAATSGMPAQPMPAASAPPVGAMSQSQFAGAGGPDPRTLNRGKLAELLRLQAAGQ